MSRLITPPYPYALTGGFSCHGYTSDVPIVAVLRRKGLPAVLVGAAVLLAAWLIVAVQLFYLLPPSKPHATDAVIMLGGKSEERLPVAMRLQDQLGVPVLALSQTNTVGNWTADLYCDVRDHTDQRVLCFSPQGMDTRGEAAEIGRLVADHGWRSITVVTSRYHVSRAETLIEQCTTAQVQMVASDPGFGPGEWLRRFVIESAGLVDAKIRPECPVAR
jgi:uncharacterized SAM-binding protein YcdF (DUF218 family)